MINQKVRAPGRALLAIATLPTTLTAVLFGWFVVRSDDPLAILAELDPGLGDHIGGLIYLAVMFVVVTGRLPLAKYFVDAERPSRD